MATRASDELYAAYNDAIGSLMLARKQYADACEAHGTESSAAEQARDLLAQAVAHRDQIRAQYEAASREETAG